MLTVVSAAFVLAFMVTSALAASAQRTNATMISPVLLSPHDLLPLTLPDSMDLRPHFQKWGLAARRQGARGTCSVFAVTGALEYAVAIKQGHGTQLSVEFLNWAAHKAAGRTVDGGFFSELWKGYEVYGICPESDLPYRAAFDAALHPDLAVLERAKSLKTLGLTLHWVKEWDVNTGLTTSQWTEIKKTLAQERPVCGGFRWPKKPQWKEGVLQMCPPEEVFDGHSVLLVGYRDEASQPGGGAFLIRNSGGDGSDGLLPYAYAMAYMNDAAWIGTGNEPLPGTGRVSK
jgi:hypothetical protein